MCYLRQYQIPDNQISHMSIFTTSHHISNQFISFHCITVHHASIDLAFEPCEELPSKASTCAVVVLFSAVPSALTLTWVWSGRYSSVATSLASASCFGIEKFGSSVSQVLLRLDLGIMARVKESSPIT